MTPDMLKRYAARASEDPFYFGWHLARYAESMGKSVEDLAPELGCLPSAVYEMSLCRAPRTEPSRFRRDIEAVANRFQVSAALLANIARHAAALSAASVTHLAARDRDPDDGERQ